MGRLTGALLIALALLGCHPSRHGDATTIEETSLLWRAGFRAGDVIETLDGAAVTVGTSPLAQLAHTPAGIERVAVLNRGGKRWLIHFATVHPKSLQVGPGASVLDLGQGRFRILVHDPGKFKEAVLAATQALGYQTQRDGYKQLPLRITAVPQDADARRLGLREGDELVRLNGRALFTREALVDNIAGVLDQTQPARLEVRRGKELLLFDFHLTGGDVPTQDEAVLSWVAILAQQADGVLVARADTASPYLDAGLSPGAVVIYAGKQKIRELEQVSLYGRSGQDARKGGYQVRRGPYRLGIPPQE
ncbi:MAG: hypothetical protein P1P84_04445 [Deferrisomatales bacterium]|nr:hypothetical protein [Deferrisomatales bacterium]